MDMRHLFSIFLLIISVCSRGQINVIEASSKPTSKPYNVLYDSLTNIREMRDD